jgi:hypothetical protein
MNRLLIVAALVALAAVLGGCPKDDAVTNPPSAPAGTLAEVEPNDMTPQSLGTLGAADIVIAGSTANANDVDRYSITLAGTTNLLVRDSASVAGEVMLSVMDGSSIMLTARRGASPQSCTLTGRTPGTYIIQVESSNTTAAGYVLRIGAR